MIRQAISCDICGAEKKHTNHWFVAYNQGGELRVCGFNPSIRLRTGSKHLCGQACLHKMIDEFISNVLSGRAPSPAVETAEIVEPAITTEVSLTSNTAYRSLDVTLKPALQPAENLLPRITTPIPSAVIAMQPRPSAEQPRPLAAQPPMEETPNYVSRHWRAEAWERERERELRSAATPRRKSS